VTILAEAKRSGLGDFRSGIRSAIRALWKGFVNKDAFIVNMTRILEKGLNAAWKEGAAEVGVIFPDEMTDAERDAIQEDVWRNAEHLPGFASAIVEKSQANKGKLGPLLVRGELWIRQYGTAVIKARAMVGADLKMEWIVDHGKESCSSCLRLEHKVKRGSYWTEHGILPGVPGAPYLICRGYNCGCTLQPTDKPMSRGPLPRLP